jgi:hypothetical protein
MTSIQSLLSSQVDADVSVVATPRRRVTATRRVDVTAADASDAGTLAAFFELPVRQVQKLFGMSEGAFTRAFRNAGIPRWPYRRVRALLGAAERPSTTSDERAMLLHEYDFLLRNTELLGLSVASEKRAVVRSVVPLPPTWPPLRAPASEPMIASLENAHSASKVVRRRAAAGKRRADGDDGVAASSATAAANVPATDGDLDSDGDAAALIISKKARVVAAAPPPPPPASLKCTLQHRHEPLCFIDAKQVAAVASEKVISRAKNLAVNSSSSNL